MMMADERQNIKKKNKIHSDTLVKNSLMAVALVSVAVVLFIILFLVLRSTLAIETIIREITGVIGYNDNHLSLIVPLLVGTLLITLGAMIFSLPIGLGAATYISEVAPKKIKEILKPMCEVLAGIPSIVYGFFGMVVIVKLLNNFMGHGDSWLAASILLGIMALPIIISVSEDAMRAVPMSYREASLAMGATRWDTTRKVVIPAAASGIATAAVLGLGRAIGETMAVIMVAGNSPLVPQPLWDIFSRLKTLTAEIAIGAKMDITAPINTSMIFLMGLVLLVMVIAVNLIAKSVINGMKRKFDAQEAKVSRLGRLFRKIPGYGAVASRMPGIKRSFLMLTLFILIWWISSQIVGSTAGAVIAFIAVAAAVSFQVARKRDSHVKDAGGPRPRGLLEKINDFAAVHMPARKMFMLIVLFIAVWMISSLMVGDIMAAGVASVAVAGVIAFQETMSRVTATNRQKVMHTALLIVAAAVVCIMIWIIGDIVIKGAPALSWNFITAFPDEMGIYPAIVGTLMLVGGTMLIAFPLGIVTGIYLSEYSKSGRITKLIQEAIDALNATPSIVYGLFGLATVVMIVGRISLIAGCVSLAFMVLPTIIRTTEEMVRAVPQELREGSLAMGATKWQTTSKVVLPAAFGGVVTGLIISIGRAAGETAPILLTAAVGHMTMRSFSFDPTLPVMALPYQLYYVSWDHPTWPIEMQYGIALVLLILVLSIFALATVVRYRSNKKVRW